MSPVAWALKPLKQYADFSGRAPRAEYWWFVLFVWGGLVLLGFFGAMMLGAASGPDAFVGFFMVPVVIAVLALFIPNLAVQVRRLHDQDRSGWMILLFFIPYVGGIIAIVFMCLSGTTGPNRYGPDPYEDEYLEEVFA
jgi:uncharacterized membrane protein YhaH (DUF805 family)